MILLIYIINYFGEHCTGWSRCRYVYSTKIIKYQLILLIFIASGDGEYIMRFCPSFQIVQLMHEGMKAREACNIVVEQMLRQSGQQFEVAVIALDTKVSTRYAINTMFCIYIAMQASTMISWMYFLIIILYSPRANVQGVK